MRRTRRAPFMTDDDRNTLEREAGPYLGPTYPMTPAHSAQCNLMARRIYLGLKNNSEIADRQQRREQRELIYHEEMHLLALLCMTQHGLVFGYEKSWNDGYRVKIVRRIVPERGQQKPPGVDVFFDPK